MFLFTNKSNRNICSYFSFLTQKSSRLYMQHSSILNAYYKWMGLLASRIPGSSLTGMDTSIRVESLCPRVACIFTVSLKKHVVSFGFSQSDRGGNTVIYISFFMSKMSMFMDMYVFLLCELSVHIHFLSFSLDFSSACLQFLIVWDDELFTSERSCKYFPTFVFWLTGLLFVLFCFIRQYFLIL